jgi:hypothetical protein
MKLGEIDAFVYLPELCADACGYLVTTLPVILPYIRKLLEGLRDLPGFYFPKTEGSKAKISCLTNFLLFFFHLFDQTHQALNFWLGGDKNSAQLLLGVMCAQKLIDIHLPLPTTNYKSAGKHVILGPAEPKINLTAHPGTSDRFVVVLLNHLFNLQSKLVHSQYLRIKYCE